ncbi:helix-turn-helix transcriptional regulator [Streptomyces sp. H27-H1]|uniref:response regulator transcription factor n=1 Tax=Streptomyces sp. H27-H1 TaxID=2996461 RepID=UPI00226FAC35|nr:helix-turn-helix transcriptional regulator [Streptomyces sp. H27-H1]MCY0928350.1 helix-turn-helix transcriptional regulator [Streptomyces sp. H27-H1]
MTRRRILTRRQIEVLTLAANGNTAAQIAAWLWVTPDTVNTTLQNAYRNLGVHDRAQAVAVALRLQLIPLTEIRIPDELLERVRPQEPREAA